MERFLFNEHMEKVRQILIKVVAVAFLVVSFLFLYYFLNSPTENGEFVKNNNVKRQPEYKDLILFQIKDGN